MTQSITVFFLSLFVLFNFCSCTDEKSNSQSEVVDSTVEQSVVALNKRIKSAPSNPALYMERAALHASSEDFSAAINDVNRAISIDSTKADYFATKASYLIDNKQVGDARYALMSALDLDSDNVKAHLLFSEMYIWLDDFEKAITSANKALKQDVHNARGYYLKGLAFKYLGDTAKAVSSFQTSIEQNPDFFDGYLQLGLLFSIARHPLALDYYNNAIDVEPNNLQARYNKALFLQDMERSEEALEAYDELLAIDASYRDAYYNKGFVYLMQTDSINKAISAFKRVLEIDSHHVNARYNLGYCYELSGKPDSALTTYRKTLKFKSNHTLAAKGVGRLID